MTAAHAAPPSARPVTQQVTLTPAHGQPQAALLRAHPVLRRAATEDPGPGAGAWVISCAADAHATTAPDEEQAADGALWWISVAEPPALERATFGPTAAQAVDDARRLLRALPWGWAAVPDGPLQLGRAARLDPGAGPPPVAVVEGRSLSGAALLALGAAYYSAALPQDVVASLDLDPRTGRALPVGGVEAKARALRRLAPAMRRVLVAADQVEAWAAALARAGLTAEVRGVTTGTQLVDEVLRPAEQLADLAAEQLRLTLDHLRRLTLTEGMAAALSWPGVCEALVALRARMPDERLTLELLDNVARRYAGQGSVDAPSKEVFDAALGHPSPKQRHTRLAHAVQGCAHAAAPLPEGVQGRLPPPDAGQLAHRVHGAWARWLLVAGEGTTEARARRAMEAHAQIVHILLQDDDLDELSYSLSDWLRLAGGLSDTPAFREAAAVLDRLRASADVSARDLAFARLAWARGVAALGEALPTGRAAAIRDLHALRGRINPDDPTGPYAGLGFLDPIIYRTLILLGETSTPAPLPPSGRTAAFLALHAGALEVDGYVAAEEEAYRPAARGVAGPRGDGEERRRARILWLYGF